MNVLHIGAGNLFGGIETLLVTLARHRGLCREMMPSFALCFEGRVAAELRQTGAPVYLLGGVRVRWPLTIWRARRSLARLLKAHRFDVVICHSPWPQAIFGPVVRAAGLPLVHWLHAAADGTHWLERWAMRTRPDRIVCNSQFTAARLANPHREIPSEVIYCPVAFPDLSLSDAERRAIRADLKTPQDAVVVIQVSRMEPLKGQELHLEALAGLTHCPGWVCWQVGGARQTAEMRYLEELQRLSIRFGIGERVRFMGERSDVPRLLAAADIYCQPNTSPDSFGISFIEGLSAQLPVITTAIGGALEIVDAECGILVPPGVHAALSTALRQLITDPALRSRLGRAGPIRARNLCDPRAQIMRLSQFVQQTIISDLAA